MLLRMILLQLILINFPGSRNYPPEFNLRRFYNALHRSSFTNRNDFLKQFNVNSAAINNILQARTINCMGHLLMGRANNTVAHPTKILREPWTHPAAPTCCGLKIEVHSVEGRFYIVVRTNRVFQRCVDSLCPKAYDNGLL